ncbi:MAG: hypothetical protein M5U12_11155 [Verrucomicrobia bacterium]|nr:hypothetical protein [Verrucomicrobiota bacterium]
MQHFTRFKAPCLPPSPTACLSLLLLAPSLASLQAELLLTEPFAYPDGPLVDVSGGRWATHSGTAGQVNVRAEAVDLTDQESEDVNLALPSSPLPASSDAVLYAAFTVNFTALPRGPAPSSPTSRTAPPASAAGSSPPPPGLPRGACASASPKPRPAPPCSKPTSACRPITPWCAATRWRPPAAPSG